MRLAKRVFVLAFVTVTAIQIWSLFVYLNDQRYLSKLADRIIDPALPASEQVKSIVIYLRDRPVISNQSYFLIPVLSFLRPTGRQVAEQGGDCADRSRLLINLLALRNVKASKWALYNNDLVPKHAAVEVEVETGKMVVDPLYGLWFPKGNGGYYSIQELKADPSILVSRIQYLIKQGEQAGALALQGYPLDDYVYTHARTVNWNKTSAMRFAYALLYSLFGEKVNTIPRPAFVEQPALVMAIGIAGIQIIFLGAWIGLMLRTPRRINR